MWSVLRKTLITIYFWLGVVLATLITGLCVMIFVICNFMLKQAGGYELLPAHTYVTMCIEDIMANFIFLWMTFPRIWKVSTWEYPSHKLDNIRKNKYILASNHGSFIDTLFMALLPFKKTYTYNLKWSNIPVFGWMCLHAGYIGINPMTKGEVVEKTVHKVNMGYSVMIYPEGKRSHTQEKLLTPLKTGAFRIARESQTPILPLTFVGMSKAANKYGVIDAATMHIVVNKPQIVSESGDFEKDIEMFRNTIEETLHKYG